MKEILEILKYILPSVVVALLAWYIIREFLNKQLMLLENEIKLRNQEGIRPVVIQAFERMVLFLERISPANIILRVSKPEYTSLQLQGILLQTIRNEFEHNLSQQLFISGLAWERIKQAKEDTIRIIINAASLVNPESNGSELAGQIFEAFAREKKTSIEEALDILKKEIIQYL